jgi:hypothetical protein
MKFSIAPESINAWSTEEQAVFTDAGRVTRFVDSDSNVDVNSACLNVPTSAEAETASFLTH